MSDPHHIQFLLTNEEQAALHAYQEDFHDKLVMGPANGFVYERLVEAMRDKGYFDPAKQKEIHDRVRLRKPRSAP